MNGGNGDVTYVVPSVPIVANAATAAFRVLDTVPPQKLAQNPNVDRKVDGRGAGHAVPRVPHAGAAYGATPTGGNPAAFAGGVTLVEKAVARPDC